MIKKTAKVTLISDEPPQHTPPSGSSYRRPEAKNENEQAPGTVESDAAEKNDPKALSTMGSDAGR
jgi:hypothetical protein